MKKILKIAAVNIFIVILILGILEAFSYLQYTNKHKDSLDKLNNAFAAKIGRPLLSFGYKMPRRFNYEIFKKVYRNTVYGDNSKGSILLFGDSFAQGFLLKDNQTLHYKLSKKTGRTVYNRAMSSMGPAFTYYSLLNDKNLTPENANIKSIYYILIWDHLNRLYTYYCSPFGNQLNIRYEEVIEKKDERKKTLKEIEPSFIPFYSSFLVKEIQEIIVNHKFYNEENNFELFNALMSETIKLSKEKYPGSKFVILEYPDWYNKRLPEKEIETLKSFGADFINVEELVEHTLTDKEYLIEDGLHPSEKAWDEISDKLIETVKL